MRLQGAFSCCSRGKGFSLCAAGEGELRLLGRLTIVRAGLECGASCILVLLWQNSEYARAVLLVRVCGGC